MQGRAPRRRKRQVEKFDLIDGHPLALPGRLGPQALAVSDGGVHLFRAPPTRVDSRSRGNFDIFIIMLSGKYFGRARVGDRDIEVAARPGDVVFWPKGTDRFEHNDPADNMEAFVLAFLWPRRILTLPSILHDHRRMMTLLAHSILSVQNTLTPQRRTIIESFASAAVGEYVRLASESADDELVAKVVRFVQENVRRRFRLADLSRHVGLDPSYFAQRYKQLTGRTPMQDVRRIRVEHAVAILHGSPNVPLKNVAYRIGMGSSQLLSRWLRRDLNLTSRMIRTRRTIV
jgi:AraC-like DNA-binding protein